MIGTGSTIAWRAVVRNGSPNQWVAEILPRTLSVVSERAMGGHYLDISVDRKESAHYELDVGLGGGKWIALTEVHIRQLLSITKQRCARWPSSGKIEIGTTRK